MSRVFFLVLVLNIFVAHAFLDPTDTGILGQTNEENYDYLIDVLFSEDRVIQTFDDKLWVPWYGSSSQCSLNELKTGNSCNVGHETNLTHNCMVTDEFSQIGILVAMGDNQTRMDQFFETTKSIQTDFGKLPSWRVYRNGDTIEQCKSGVNGNCDTASDADARIIIGLYIGSEQFNNSEYKEYADDLLSDLVEYEIHNECFNTSMGLTCNWLAAGPQARNGGMGTTDFGYTGYYADAILALLMGCVHNGTYCSIAQDLTKNYLVAAKFDGEQFSAPPGRSFRWDTSGEEPHAICTNGCSPVKWDDADAPRAIGMCQALQYASYLNVTLPGLQNYCAIWQANYASDPTRIPLQYTPTGSISSYQSGYFAQGLQTLFYAGINESLVGEAVNDAISHYSDQTKSWDYQACFGVYKQSLALRGLGVALQKDVQLFTNITSQVNQTPQIASLQATCQPSCTKTSDEVVNSCRVMTYETLAGPIHTQACQTGSLISLHRQIYPSVYDFKQCLDGWCVTPQISSIQFTLGTNPPVETEKIISQLDVFCTNQCTLTYDVTSGDCRTIEFSTTQGDITAMACEKPGEVIEIYRQQYPNSDFSLCFGLKCISQDVGFAQFELKDIGLGVNSLFHILN